MTQAQIDNYCQRCYRPEDCGFLTRNMQRKCNQIQAIEDGYDLGYEDAVEKACKWWKDKWLFGPEEIGTEHRDLMIEQFRKAMEQ